MNLTEWTVIFIDNSSDIISKDVKENEIICISKKKGVVKYIIQPLLGNEIMQKIKEGQICIVCLNSKTNLRFLIENWPELIKNPGLKIIFANPELNMQWIIIPYVHNMVSDPSTLKLGLKSIFESVPEIIF